MSDSETKPRSIWHDGIDMAYDLIERHPELLADCPPPSDILFVMDTVNEPTSKGRPIPAKVSKISGKLVDFLDAGERTWMLEWFSQNNGYMTPNQTHILLLQQLLLFEADGNGGHRIGGWDIQESEIIADRLGLKWHSQTRGEAPDIMDSSFQWGRVGQSRIRFVLARAEEQRQKDQAQGAVKPKPEQATLDLSGGIYLKPDEKATLHVSADGKSTLEISGPEGTRQVPAVTTTADGWQPDKPLVSKEGVVPLVQPADPETSH